MPEFKKVLYKKCDLYTYKGIRRDPLVREPETVRWVENIGRGILYDIGSNVGIYSLIAAKMSKCRVYAFEPVPTTFWGLVHNVIKNKLEDQIIPVNIPLSDEMKVGLFNYADLKIGKALHAFGKAIAYNGKPFKPKFKQLMISHSIDDLVQKFGFDKPDFVKLDVDSIEVEILHGMKETLPNIRSMMVETEENHNKKEIVAFLKKHGLKLAHAHKHNLTSNIIFKR